MIINYYKKKEKPVEVILEEIPVKENEYTGILKSFFDFILNILSKFYPNKK